MPEIQDSYFELHLRGLSQGLEESVSNLCFEAGALGISQPLLFHQSGDKYEPETIKSSKVDLDVYFSKAPEEHFLQQLEAEIGEAQLHAEQLKNRDWLQEWKKGLEEFEILPGFWVVPSWRSCPPEAKNSVTMDPGMAFGTGTHETTRIAAHLLRGELLERPISRLLDVGTGTGLLGLIAEKLGVEQVQGCEIDPQAREVARDNLRINNSQCFTVVDEPVAEIGGEFDVVLANIIDGVLLELAQDLIRLVAPRGQLILTGILEEREERFLQRFPLPEDFRWARRWQLGDWVGWTARRG